MWQWLSGTLSGGSFEVVLACSIEHFVPLFILVGCTSVVEELCLTKPGLAGPDVAYRFVISAVGSREARGGNLVLWLSQYVGLLSSEDLNSLECIQETAALRSLTGEHCLII
jgi:hypothetical protein